ncbi:MAG: amidohydrolase family protein [Pseudomonadota bacterium]|nr:amidohydrolase family protein [Pseudomonadota bacterium]
MDLTDKMIVNGVVHALNGEESNLTDMPVAAQFRDRIWLYHRKFSPDNEYRMSPDEYLRDHAVETVEHALFAESQCQMGVYHSTPIFDFFRDGLTRFEKGVELKKRNPKRVLLYGRVNFTDLPNAIRDMEQQVEQGADGFKFYPSMLYEGRTLEWRMDDAKQAYPLYEKALDLGVKNIAVHKAHPFGPTSITPFRVDDVEGAAAAFPEINFQVVHAGLAFVEETSLMIGRFPNVYGTLETTWSYLINHERLFAEAMAMLLHWGSVDKLIFADSCSTQHSRPALEKFANFQFPDDILEGWGIAPLTEDDKLKILGANMLSLHDINPAARMAELKGDKWDVLRKEKGLQPPWSTLRGGGEIGEVEELRHAS